MEYSETEKTSLVIAGGVVVFSIAAIIAYFYTRGGAPFYLIATIAIIIEFYLAYRISQEGNKQAPRHKKKARKAQRPKKKARK
jgi:4-hydroxybenzoate polyprenyltransferase